MEYRKQASGNTYDIKVTQFAQHIIHIHVCISSWYTVKSRMNETGIYINKNNISNEKMKKKSDRLLDLISVGNSLCYSTI